MRASERGFAIMIPQEESVCSQQSWKEGQVAERNHFWKGVKGPKWNDGHVFGAAKGRRSVLLSTTFEWAVMPPQEVLLFVSH